jgi:hypothetical protein
MARLFISPREIQLINDWTKEYVKDVIGQKIYYYPVSTMKTMVHDVYNEAINKIFENPFILSVLVGQPKWETKHNQFGMEQTTTVELWVQVRDLIDRGLTLAEGDFFTYGDAVFEVVSYLQMNNIFGQEEYEVSYKIVGRLARPGQFDPKDFFKPQKDSNNPFIQSPVQQTFVQQRGLKETQEGATGDFRQLRDRLKDDMAPIALGEGPKKVDTTSVEEDKEKASSFNNENIPPNKGFYDE